MATERSLDITVVRGKGEGTHPKSAFDQALNQAGIANYNLIPLSSIIPEGSTVAKARRFDAPPKEYGNRLYIIEAKTTSDQPGETVAAGLGWYQTPEGKGVFLEDSVTGIDEKVVRSSIHRRIEDAVRELCDSRGFQVDPEKLRVLTSIARVVDRPTCVVVLAVYKSEGWEIVIETKGQDSPKEVVDVITDPDDQYLIDFHRLLTNNLRPQEVEPLDIFQAELESNQKNPKHFFILTVIQDETDPNKPIKDTAYGSVIEDEILAFRFTKNEAEHRGAKASYRAENLLIKEGRNYCQEKGNSLKVIVVEGINGSESYWNGLEIEEGNSMRRLFYRTRKGNLKEMYYQIPPLEWNPDGTPAGDGIAEHLHVAFADYPNSIPTDLLAETLHALWREWYIRPQEQFESDAAWEKHKATVFGILERKILKPLSKYQTLDLLSKEERRAAKNL